MKRIDILRRSFRDKRGVELTLNTVIIAILVVLVLVVLIGFFLGGTGKAKSQIQTLFGEGASAPSVSIVIEQCKTYCDQIEDAGMSDEDKKASLYCTREFKLDINGDGTVEAESFKCSGAPIFVNCNPSVTCSSNNVKLLVQ